MIIILVVQFTNFPEGKHWIFTTRLHLSSSCDQVNATLGFTKTTSYRAIHQFSRFGWGSVLVCIDKVIQNIDLVRTFGALHETMASTSPLGTCRRGVQRMFCEFLTGRYCSPRKKTWQFAGISVKRRVSVLDDFARCLGFGADCWYISSATGRIRSLFVNGQYIYLESAPPGTKFVHQNVEYSPPKWSAGWFATGVFLLGGIFRTVPPLLSTPTVWRLGCKFASGNSCINI